MILGVFVLKLLVLLSRLRVSNLVVCLEWGIFSCCTSWPLWFLSAVLTCFWEGSIFLFTTQTSWHWEYRVYISFLSFTRYALKQLRASWPLIIGFQHSHFFGRRRILCINFESISVFIIILVLHFGVLRLRSDLTFGHSLRSVIRIGYAIRNLPWVIAVSSSRRRLFKQLSTYISTSLVKEIRSTNFMILHWVLTLNNISKSSWLILIAHSMSHTKGFWLLVIRLNLDFVFFFFFSLYFFF